METAQVANSLQLLSFTLDDEVFAVEISRVREVLEYKGTTKIPRVPDFMRGVINLRGNVVPVIDLKQKFGIGYTEQGLNTCVIIAEVETNGESVILGALADAVREVFDLETQNIEPPPKIGTRLDTEFIKGMGKYNEGFVILLDIDRVFSGEDISALSKVDAA
jgi:chemotaxis signal transduction protein